MNVDPLSPVHDIKEVLRFHRYRLDQARAAYRRNPFNEGVVRWLGSAENDVEALLEYLEEAEAEEARSGRA